MKRSPGLSLVLDAVRESLISSSGAVLLNETVRVAGVDRLLAAALAPWRSDRVVHDPGKVLLDVATAVALGGDCLADLAVVRAQPELFGPVASDPTVSRVIAKLAADIDASLPAIRDARARARASIWGRRSPLRSTTGGGSDKDSGRVVVDLDATLVSAQSDKEHAEPTFKKTFGFAPMCAFVDHGPGGTGEALALDLRPGKASPHASADHITTLGNALEQLGEAERSRVLVRADTGGCSKAFMHHITDLGLEYSIGFPAMDTVAVALAAIPRQAWRSALDADENPREGAQVAELTAWMPTPTKPTRSPARFGPQHWPEDMRIIARRERPHPGAQLRLTDHQGWRITCFATNTKRGRIADLEVRHRLRARAEDRIRGLKDTGMRNLPFHGYAQNQIWLEIVALAADLLTWTQTLAFTANEPARRWEPKRLRLRILAVAGRIIRTGRRRRLRLPRDWPYNPLIESGWTALRTT
ncbi:IS1380 family transposase [Jiangella muralis]|uniref:IS1380 family transposase n=1 Tax=Jiangella muralis TaxID=702383 RepID=UPI00069DEF72|nr:IS1380 family transposase [Jiangella muralis]